MTKKKHKYVEQMFISENSFLRIFKTPRDSLYEKEYGPTLCFQTIDNVIGEAEINLKDVIALQMFIEEYLGQFDKKTLKKFTR